MDITIIGAGGVATSLAHALLKAGHQVVQVYSRTGESARLLADAIGCSWTTNLAELTPNSHIYIISVNDDALTQINTQLLSLPHLADSLFVHTAGSVSIDTLTTARRGVLYPMQTFTRSRIVPMAQVPLFVEANSEADTAIIERLAHSLSASVMRLSSADRQWLHVAAVFCCNFANHCSTLAAGILESHGIPFSVMLPLIDETARKLHEIHPVAAQTGPAQRGDTQVMNKHLQMLNDNPNIQNIYKMLSQSIQNSNL